MNPKRIWADLVVFGKGYLRNPLGLFFSLAFPLILILLFGAIFSNSSSTPAVSVQVENLDGGSATSTQFLAALNSTGVVQITVVNPTVAGTGDGFSQWLGRQSDPAGLVIPSGFAANYSRHVNSTLMLYTNPTNAEASGVALAAVEGVATQFNLHAVNGSAIVGVSTHNVGGQSLHYIDYLVPGLIGFTILTSPMFAMVDISASYRKDHLFRQLSLTPLTKGEWLTAKIAWYILLTFASAAVMIAAGAVIFGSQVRFELGMIPFLILGPFFFVSLGMLAGSVTKTPETAAVVGNLVTFPMMFLSGTFFPVSGFPAGLQLVAKVLPLFYVIDGMNQVLLFGNTSAALLDISVIFVVAIVVFVAAILAFKWRDE